VLGGTYFGKLPPVQEVTGIILKDENVVDLVVVPYSTSQGKQQNEKICQKVSSIYLFHVSPIETGCDMLLTCSKKLVFTDNEGLSG
jgi:hypothetical protein